MISRPDDLERLKEMLVEALRSSMLTDDSVELNFWGDKESITIDPAHYDLAPRIDADKLAQTVSAHYAELAQYHFNREFDEPAIGAWLRHQIDPSFDPLTDEHYAKHIGGGLMATHGDALAKFEAGDMSGTVTLTGKVEADR